MSPWWAAALAGLLYYLLGAVWFTPLFGKVWDRSIGYDRAVSGGRFPAGYYIVPLVGSLVATAVIAWLIRSLSVTDARQSALVGAGVGLAIAAASLTNALTPHTPRPYVFAAVTGGYHLAGCTLAGLVLGFLAP